MTEEFRNNNSLVWLLVLHGAERQILGPYANTETGKSLWVAELKSCQIDGSVIKKASESFGIAKDPPDELLSVHNTWRVVIEVEKNTEVSTKLHQAVDEYTMLYVLRIHEMDNQDLAQFLRDKKDLSAENFRLETFLDIREAIHKAAYLVTTFCVEAGFPSKYIKSAFGQERKDKNKRFQLSNTITTFKVDTGGGDEAAYIRLFSVYIPN
jgi:hypothetical protein